MLNEVELSGSYEALFQQAHEYLQGGKTAEAIQIFRRLHHRLGRLSEKVRKLRPELDDLRIMAIEVLATLLQDEKNFDEAEKLYRELIETAPEEAHNKWKHALVWIAINRGDVDAGLDELQTLTVAYPDDQSLWVSLGGILVRKDRLDEAEEAFKRAIALPSHGEDGGRMIYGMLFVLYKRQKRFDDAEKIWLDWQKSSGIADSIPLYEMYLEYDMPERLERRLEKEKDPVIRGFYKAEMARRRGEMEIAQKWWRKVAAHTVEAYDYDVDMWAEAMLHTNADPQEVFDVLEEGLASGIISMRGMLLFAVVNIRMDGLDAAERILDTYRQRMIDDHLAENDKISYSIWQLFASLVSDENHLERFRKYFNTEPLPKDDEA